MNAEDYLSVLNKEQREAVVHEGSPLLILAGAGSGKTRVITTKIAYMISELGINPASILAVTFTKKAAEEMKERAVGLDERAQKSHIRTFHSFGAWFLRLFAEESGIGLKGNFTVYDDEDVATLISNTVPSLTKKDALHYAKKISLAKDYCLLPGDLELDRICDEPLFSEVYEKYQQRLRNTGNVDFGDLILLPYLILKENDLIRKSFHARYRAILVDEYQDSNVAQFKLLKELSGIEENSGTYVCVVGDDDQSIYKFRGAEIQNILNFKDEFPGTKIIRLETNYRSTSEILNCAGNVVRNNSGRLGKELVSARGKGKMPALVFLPSQDDETEFCFSLIEQAFERGIPYSDWAILYRTNAQSLGFETEFLHKKIPYEVVGSLKFYEREEIKDIVSWLSFIINPRDEISFRRIVNKPVRGIGNKTQDKIIEASGGSDSILTGADSIKLSKKAKDEFALFKSLVENFSAGLPDVPVTSEAALLAGQAINESDAYSADEKKLSEFIERVVKESGLADFHKEQDDETGTQKTENLQELVNSALLYPCTKQGLLDFLDHINLDRTLKANSEEENKEDKVTLITLHNTKGLEFKRVIITGMESGIFPREGKTEAELEEERRLFYVGITRAKDELYFTSCGMRRLFGKTSFMIPSPFLGELGSGVRVLGQKPESFSSGRQEKSPLEKKYCTGACVFHDDYGHGQIVKCSYSDEGEYVVTVSFETGGIKKFLPKYQKNSLLVEDNL